MTSKWNSYVQLKSAKLKMSKIDIKIEKIRKPTIEIKTKIKIYHKRYFKSIKNRKSTTETETEFFVSTSGPGFFLVTFFFFSILRCLSHLRRLSGRRFSDRVVDLFFTLNSVRDRFFVGQQRWKTKMYNGTSGWKKKIGVHVRFYRSILAV